MTPETDFHHTRMGHTFYDRTLPRIADALEKIAAQLEMLTSTTTRDDVLRALGVTDSDSPESVWVDATMDLNEAAFDRMTAEQIRRKYARYQRKQLRKETR